MFSLGFVEKNSGRAVKEAVKAWAVVYKKQGIVE